MFPVLSLVSFVTSKTGVECYYTTVLVLYTLLALVQVTAQVSGELGPVFIPYSSINSPLLGLS